MPMRVVRVSALQIFIPPPALPEFHLCMHTAGGSVLQHDFAFGITPNFEIVVEVVLFCGGRVAVNADGDMWRRFLGLFGDQLRIHDLPGLMVAVR